MRSYAGVDCTWMHAAVLLWQVVPRPWRSIRCQLHSPDMLRHFVRCAPVSKMPPFDECDGGGQLATDDRTSEIDFRGSSGHEQTSGFPGQPRRRRTLARSWRMEGGSWMCGSIRQLGPKRPVAGMRPRVSFIHYHWVWQAQENRRAAKNSIATLPTAGSLPVRPRDRTGGRSKP